MDGGLNIENIQVLLGRELTPIEVKGFDLYLAIASKRLADILCLDLLPNPLPCDLAQVLAGFFGTVATSQVPQGDIESKKVEDFSITYKDTERGLEAIVKSNLSILSKYSACENAILHGETLLDYEEDCCGCKKVRD